MAAGKWLLLPRHDREAAAAREFYFMPPNHTNIHPPPCLALACRAPAASTPSPGPGCAACSGPGLGGPCRWGPGRGAGTARQVPPSAVTAGPPPLLPRQGSFPRRGGLGRARPSSSSAPSSGPRCRRRCGGRARERCPLSWKPATTSRARVGGTAGPGERQGGGRRPRLQASAGRGAAGLGGGGLGGSRPRLAGCPGRCLRRGVLAPGLPRFAEVRWAAAGAVAAGPAVARRGAAGQVQRPGPGRGGEEGGMGAPGRGGARGCGSAARWGGGGVQAEAGWVASASQCRGVENWFGAVLRFKTGWLPGVCVPAPAHAVLLVRGSVPLNFSVWRLCPLPPGYRLLSK